MCKCLHIRIFLECSIKEELFLHVFIYKTSVLDTRSPNTNYLPRHCKDIYCCYCSSCYRKYKGQEDNFFIFLPIQLSWFSSRTLIYTASIFSTKAPKRRLTKRRSSKRRLTKRRSSKRRLTKRRSSKRRLTKHRRSKTKAYKTATLQNVDLLNVSAQKGRLTKRQCSRS